VNSRACSRWFVDRSWTLQLLVCSASKFLRQYVSLSFSCSMLTMFFSFPHLQTVESRLEEVRSQVGNAANVMETDDSGSGNMELEADYFTLLGKSLARCVEELLVVSYMVVGGAKENGRNDVTKQIRTAIEQTGLDTRSALLLVLRCS
jgi:hypothetical protein